MSMERYEITAPDGAEGYPPFVVDGAGTNTVIADGVEELSDWLLEAGSHDIPATWRQLPDEQS